MNNSVTLGAAVAPHAKAPFKASPMATGQVSVIPREVASQVKLFMLCDTATWLLAETDYDDVVFGPCDLEQGSRELGYGDAERAVPWLRCSKRTAISGKSKGEDGTK